MSLEINSSIIGGNLTRDVVLKEVGAGRTVASFCVASNRTYVMNGEKKQEVSFIDVDVWGAIAQNCAQYLKKGSLVVVVGRLKQDTWKAPDGTNRSKLKILASNVQFMPTSQRNSGSSEGADVAYETAGWDA